MSTKKILLIIGGVILVFTFLVLIFVGVIVGVAIYQIGNSEAAVKAKDFLRNNQQLKDDIGEVKDFGNIVTGSVSVANHNGTSTINLKVIGSRKTVNASVDLIFIQGSTWRVSSASYVNDSGRTVSLLDPYDSNIIDRRLGNILICWGVTPWRSIPPALSRQKGTHGNYAPTNQETIPV